MFKIWSQNIIPTTVNNIPIITDKIIPDPIIFCASSFLPCPNFIETFVAEPTPTSIPNANIIVAIGIVTPSPAIAIDPTPGIFPINILSTTLYNALTNIPIMAGTEYFIRSFPIGSCPNSS